MNYTVWLIEISYYAIFSLGFLAVLLIAIGLWSAGLNFIYKRIKSSNYFFEYFLYRKDFIKWFKSK